MSVSDKALLRAISEDRALGSAVLFDHRHEFDSPVFHVTIMDLWRSADEYVEIEAFREGAKTTLAEEFLTMEACFGNFFYCVIFGETYTKACQKIEAIAHEARTNVKIHKLFGRVLAKNPVENKVLFTSGTLIEGAGWEQEVTGFKYLSRRPDRFYLDDVENKERVRDSAAVDATVRKLYQEIIPAGDKARLKVRVTETPRAADCLVTRLRANPDWLCAAYPICNMVDIDDPKAESLWPSKYPMEWIRKRRDQFERAGMLREFQQEYLLTVDTSSTKPFTDDMIRSVDIAPAAWLPRKAIYDPARTNNPGTSCRYGKVVVSRMGSKIIVHESGGYFWKPDECRTDMFATWEKHHCSEVGVEKDSLDEYLLQPIRYEALRRGVVLPLKPLNAPQDRNKNEFIMGLQPFFQAGDVVLVGGKGMHPQLVAELTNFPGGKLDIANALAYSLRMFAGDPVYEDFGEANVGPAPGVAASDTVYVCWNASPSELVAVTLLKRDRHWYVPRDFAAGGPVTDAARMVLADLRAAFPRAKLEHYAPAELHDAWNRIALVPALRGEKINAWRGENVALARGALADAVRMTIRDARCLTVAKDAPRVLAALAGDYKYPVGSSGTKAHEPEPGIARLVAEALETAIAQIARGFDNDADSGKQFALNAQGVRYHTALPQRRT